MNVQEILSRVEERLSTIGMSAAEASRQATGSPDLIRNWSRRDKGGPSATSLAKLAPILGVTVGWLMDGETDRQVTGMSEDAASFTPKPGSHNPIAEIFTSSGQNVAMTHRVSVAMPAFGMLPGDLLVCDLSRLPRPGELAIATVTDEEAGSAISLVRRYLPPWLLSGELTSDPKLERTDLLGVTIRYPIVGVIRGVD